MIRPDSSENDYISDFDSLKSALTIKYGEPTDDKTIWKNSLYRDDKEEWGLAISIGHLYYYTSWKTDTTEISLGLIGDNFEINFFIDYSSIALAELEKQQRQESSQSDL
jgi:hypothetical protein